MTNFEKYKDFFEKWAGREPIAIVNNKPKRCLDISCNNCDLKKDEPSCTTFLVKWLYEEAKPELTRKQRAFCEMVGTGWLAADKDGALFYYEDKPPSRSESNEGVWATNGKMAKTKPIYLNDMFPKFPFITWENSPVSIETLLNER